MKLYKKILSVCIVVASVLSVSACSFGKNAANDGIYRIGVLSIDDSFPIYAAEKEGYFKKAGVNVKIIPFKSSSEESQAMEAGKIDMMMNDMVVQSVLKKAGTPSKVVATAYGALPDQGRFVVLSAPGSGIKKPEDFYNKKIAISKNTMMEYLVESYFRYLNLDLSKIKFVNIPNLGTRLEALISGKDIQGAILPDPLASLAAMKGSGNVIDDTTLKENFSQSVLLVPDSVIKDRKEDTKAVVKAIFEAMDNINNDPKKFMKLEREFSRIPKQLQNTYPMPHYTTNAVPSPEQVEAVQEWASGKKLINGKYSYKDLVTTEFLD